MAVVLAMGCGKAEAAMGSVSGADTLAMRTDSVVEYDEYGSRAISVDYIADSTSTLALLVNEYVSEQMGGSYDGDLSNVAQMLRHYAGEQRKRQQRNTPI